MNESETTSGELTEAVGVMVMDLRPGEVVCVMPAERVPGARRLAGTPWVVTIGLLDGYDSVEIVPVEPEMRALCAPVVLCCSPRRPLIAERAVLVEAMARWIWAEMKVNALAGGLPS
jgi:hypothetical protein